MTLELTCYRVTWSVGRADEFIDGAQYRVLIDAGVLLLYAREPPVMVDGDKDRLISAHGPGSWLSLAVEWKQPEKVQ